jgi:hypothetical protein
MQLSFYLDVSREGLFRFDAFLSLFVVVPVSFGFGSGFACTHYVPSSRSVVDNCCPYLALYRTSLLSNHLYLVFRSPRKRKSFAN